MLVSPKYPIYIVSKGRANYMHTSRALSRMKVPHNIVIEPQDYNAYNEAISKFNMRDYVTLLVAPFSNHGDGPGRARNWAWDHSIHNGHEYHWVMDDNILNFYRFHYNKKIRVEGSGLFRACEVFLNRFENVPMGGLDYLNFVATTETWAPYKLNTRIYSCNLIRNDCKHRWRGRYNEDTILSLDILKDGDCTVLFTFLLQDKATTQTVKGGNTEEFYHKEVGLDEDTGEAIKKTDGHVQPTIEQYNPSGTIAKSQMLEDIHPDVSRVVWKFNRWHHKVDYSIFKKNKLKLKDGVVLPEGHDNFKMKLVRIDK